jgi:hypothetical protein
MFEGADERFRVERLRVGRTAGSSRCGPGSIREVFNEILDYEVFALCMSAAWYALVYFGAHTENFSRVNVGPRDVLEVVCVRMEAESVLDTVRREGSIVRSDHLWAQGNQELRSPNTAIWAFSSSCAIVVIAKHGALSSLPGTVYVAAAEEVTL